MHINNRQWWKEVVIYQIYPRSFKDSNGDGIGDLNGIISQLPYLKNLGIDVIWLSPMYKSPNADNGYDISDYQDIMTEFGTMTDFDNLLRGVHKQGMKLIIDLVVNHSSDEHYWFQESRKSKDNPYRDYYIWKQPKADGSPPNNWKSFFSGSAWDFDDATGEYYLHLFDKKQPDLNWENPNLRHDIYNMMHFWLQKGVDGFRMDVIPFLSKDQSFPDFNGSLNEYANGPRIHEFLKEMNQEVLSKYDIMTVGEGFGVSSDQAHLYVGQNRQELNMIFHFEYVSIDRDEKDFFKYNPDWKLSKFKEIIARWDKAIGQDSWNSFYWGNHDNPRCISRFGNDTPQYRTVSAKMLAIVLMTQRATPYIYQGDEIGMTNTPFNTIEEFNDVQVLNAYRELIANGTPESEIDKWIKNMSLFTRDHARTPVQWRNATNAGFTEGDKTWLKVNPNFKDINVENDIQNPDSILNFYKKMIEFRKNNFLLVYGDYEDIAPFDEKIYAYTRILGNDKMLIVNNFSDEEVIFKLEYPLSINQFLVSNYTQIDDNKDNILYLKPYESRIYALKL